VDDHLEQVVVVAPVDAEEVDINQLTRQRLLRGVAPEGQLNWDDQRTGERLLTVGYCVERTDGQTARLTLVYTVDGGAQEQTVGLTTTRLVSGGRRWWFACPRCGRWAGKLYLPPGEYHFGCRLCHGLMYR
jgi:hypothetical protein